MCSEPPHQALEHKKCGGNTRAIPSDLVDLCGQIPPVEVDLEVVPRHQEHRLPMVACQNPMEKEKKSIFSLASERNASDDNKTHFVLVIWNGVYFRVKGCQSSEKGKDGNC